MARVRATLALLEVVQTRLAEAQQKVQRLSKRQAELVAELRDAKISSERDAARAAEVLARAGENDGNA